MKKTVPRVYVDTSVFGGVFDEEFRRPTILFFERVRDGEFILVVSDVVRKELADAPIVVREFWNEVLPRADIAAIVAEATDLQKAYLDANILTARYGDDALHVALATVSNCDIIVSWNFRHIVHFDKIEKYNAVNTLSGYGHVAIHSPMEVTGYGAEDEDV